MNWLDNISITFYNSPLVFTLGVILILAYTIYIYRTTLPQIGTILKSILIFIRTLALFTILLLIFDPVLKIKSKQLIEPITQVYIDNSKSMTNFGAADEINTLNELVNHLDQLLPENTEIYTFGSEITKIKNKLDSLNFSESFTSFDDVLKNIAKTNDVASVMIISDGIINTGLNPEHKINELGIPIYTIGIGDTSTFSDLSIEQISSNKYVYVNRETDIEILVKSSGFENQNSTVQLYENNRIIETKTLVIGESGVNRIKFNYTPSTEGQFTLKAKISGKSIEKNTANNSGATVIDVLATKKKILVLAGSPSQDLSIILGSLKQNDDYEVEKIIELGQNKYLNNQKSIENIGKSEIVFFVGFPNKNTSQSFIENVVKEIEKNKIPFFFAFSNSIDLTKITMLQNILPFTIENKPSKYFSAQVTLERSVNNLLGNTDSKKQAWVELPPIQILGNNLFLSQNSNVLLKDNITQRPIVFTNSGTNLKSVVITSANIWKWKLLASNKELNLFDNFILNAIKWLSIENDKNGFSVQPSKNNYKLGEKIIFSANLFDSTLEPISDAKIFLETQNGDANETVYFTQQGNGLYEAEVLPKNAGQLIFNASVEDYEQNLSSVNGKINIEAIDIESIERRMNKPLLQSIADNSNAVYASLNEIEKSLFKMNEQFENKIYFKNTDKELRLSNFEIILIIVVLLFSIEWILRKWLRML